MEAAQMSSAAAFVEGGVQDACDDACSICLETFCDNDPATITTCKHEYHLQCILEWSQRSKECPMCWQPLSLKDPASQELLAASEQERMIHHQRSSPFYQRMPRDEPEFRRYGMFYGDDSDLEDRIMQHLAAMGRADQFRGVGESLRFRPSPGHGHSHGHGHHHPHFMIVPAHSANQSPSSLSSSTVGSGAGGPSPPPSSTSGAPDASAGSEGSNGRAPTPSSRGTSFASAHGLSISPEGAQGGNGNADSGSGALESNSSSQRHQRTPESPVDYLHGSPSGSESSFAETFKSRMAAYSSKCRDSLFKTSRGFKDRLRVRNGAVAEFGTRAAREVSNGLARAFDRMALESPDAPGQPPNPNERAEMQPGSAVGQQPGPSQSSPSQSAPQVTLDRTERQDSASNALGDRVYSCNVAAAASSVANSSPPSGVGASHSLHGTPSKAG